MKSDIQPPPCKLEDLVFSFHHICRWKLKATFAVWHPMAWYPAQALDSVWLSRGIHVVTTTKSAPPGRGHHETHSFARIDPTIARLLFISGPQVRPLYGPPIKSSTYVVHASTPFGEKPVLDLFLEIWRRPFPVVHQRVLSFLIIGKIPD